MLLRSVCKPYVDSVQILAKLSMYPPDHEDFDERIMLD